MSTNDTRKPSFDEIVESIRADEPSQAEITASADRLRASLGLNAQLSASSIHIESCAGFQALIPAYLAGGLPKETALLLEDHSRECIPCRRALIAARTPKAVPAPTVASTRPAYRRWAAAAAVAAVAVLGAYTAWQAIPLFGGDPQLKVMRVDGTLYQVTAGAMVPLRPGMTISAKNPIRTTKDGGALVMMDDGSRVELRDRTELTVAKRRDGSTVRLAGGAIIVEASPQGSGHLDVRTEDCLVAVKGTIFSVNAGMKGSRVSVVEGAVRVAADGRESLLKPGDQISTSDAVTAISVGDEISWSKDAARYTQLLNELASLRKDLNLRVPNPGLRYSSRLLDKMPDGTILYAAIPNLTEALVTAKTVFEEHIAQSGALQAWWDEHMSSPEHKQAMDEAFEKIKTLGSQLGDEIVIALTQGPDGVVRGPILMSEVKDKSEFRATLVKEMKGVNTEGASLKFDGSVVKIEFSHPVNGAKRGAKSGRASRATTAAVSSTWEASALRQKLAATSADGTSWVFAVDLKEMLAAALEQAREQGRDVEELQARWERMGVLDANSLIIERTENPEGADLHAELSFDQARRGLAAWLAAPAPLAAAEFISPDAAFAAAAVVKRPELLIAEALSWLGPEASESLGHAEALESLRALAATLGGDVAFALDGPVLPVPSYKVAIEVYDTARFQAEFTALVARLNDQLAAKGEPGRVVIEAEDSGNRTGWVVRFTDPEVEAFGGVMHYTFADGYLIAAPSRVLIDRAIEQRANAYTLARSAAFTALLPTDGHVNVSAFVWEHLGPTIGPLAAKVGGLVATEDMKSLEAMAAESHPRLVTAYAEDDRIVIGCRGGEGLGSMLGTLVSAQSLSTIGHALAQAHRAGDKTAQ